ncbi:MAG: hypothetical protein ACI4RJ_02275 [Alphaproteobacteria bacterium]
MKKVCVFVLVCMLFLLFPCQSNAWSFGEFFDEVGSTVYGAAAGAKDFFSWCNGLSQDELTKYANDVWNGNPQKIQEVEEKYNYYVDPRRANQRGCLGNAASIISAITHKCSTECAKASDALTEKNCKRCQTVVETMFNQYKADKKAVEQEKCERDAALATVGKVAGWSALAAFLPVVAVAEAMMNIISSNAETVIFSKVQAIFMTIDEGCWFCPVFDVVFFTSNKLATDLYTFFRDYLLAFLALMGFGWILFHVFKMLTTLHGPNIGEFFTQMFKSLGVLMIVCAFLTPSISFLTGYFLDVPTTFAVGLSDAILQAGDFGGGNSIEVSAYTPNPDCLSAKETPFVQTTKTVFCEPSDPKNFEGMAMSVDLHDSLRCLLKKVSIRLIRGIALGISFMAASLTAGFAGLFPDLSMLIVGILLVMGYFCLFVQIPIVMLNLILRMALVVILFPIYAACFAFPSLRGYTKRGWDMLMDVLINVITLSVFISMAIALLDAAVKL